MYIHRYRKYITITIIAFLILSSYLTIYSHQTPLQLEREIVLLEYTARTRFDYTVMLYPNIVYNTTTLINPPRVFLRPVDAIIVNIVYQFNSTPPPVDVVNSIELNISINHPQTWSRVIEYKTMKSSGLTASDVVVLNISSIISTAREISAEVDIPAYRYVINLDYVVKTTFTVLNESKTIHHPASLAINIDLAGKTIEFSPREFTYTDVEKTILVDETHVYIGPFTLPTRYLRELSLVSFMITSITTSLYLGIPFTVKYIKHRRSSVRERIKKYKSMLIKATEITGQDGVTVVKVTDLRELVKLSEELLKPIVYLENENRYVFIVDDGLVKYIFEYEETTSKPSHETT